MLSKLSYDEWHDVLSRYKEVLPDVYYYPEYYETWREYEKAEFCSLYTKVNDVHFLYPFFKKPIQGYNTNRQYYDIFTAYGYGGLLCSEEKPDENVVKEVNRQIDEWCTDQDIVAEFIRENYVHEYKGRYLRQAQHVQVRTNVYADLMVEDQCLLSRHARRDVNFGRRSRLTSNVINEQSYYDVFYNMYYATMKRINADAYYHFPKKYFMSLWNVKKLNAELIIVAKNNPIAGAICFQSGHNYIYYLSASNPEYLSERPNDYLLYSIIQRARKLGKRYVCWGGGLTIEESDPLFRFKSKYGNKSVPCHIAKKIHNKKIYQTICEQWETRFPQLKDKYVNYFLKYRQTM